MMTVPYPGAVGIAVASLLVTILIIPPLGWHVSNRNIGVSSVISWLILMNFITFVNAIIWPNDDFANSFKGQGLCDVETKLQVASQVALPASFACILRALAAVLDTNRISSAKLDKRKNLLIDLLWCIGFPLLQMPLHYIVQGARYFIFGIAGCVPAVTRDWLTVLLILLPPVIWTLICALYAGIIVARLFRYRRSFKQTLANNNSTKSRFLRLYILCLLWIIGSVPVQCFVFYVSFSTPKVPYSWADTHDPEAWAVIEMIPSNGIVLYDKYIWLIAAIVMFLFFGVGNEAVQTYRDGLKVLDCAGCSRAYDRRKRNKKLRHDHVHSATSTAVMMKSWGKDTETTTSCDSDEVEPKRATFV